MPGFEHYVAVSRYLAIAVTVPLLLGPVRGNSAAGPGGRSSRCVAWHTNGRYGKIELDSIRTDEWQRRTYGNGERYFLCKLRSSYGILTDERNSCVLLQRQRLNSTDTECWKSGISQVDEVIWLRHI